MLRPCLVGPQASRLAATLARGQRPRSILFSSSHHQQQQRQPQDPVVASLLTYKICPFCNKTKAVLDYFQVPYTNTEVNPLTKRELKVAKEEHGFKKVPVLHLQGKYIGDSAVIVDEVLKMLRDKGEISQETALLFASPRAQKWAAWAEKDLAVLLYPNITRTLSDSLKAFSYVHSVESFSTVDKYANHLLGSLAMWAAASRIKKKYGIDDEREALTSAALKWSAQIQGEHPFLGGEEPNLGDLSVFGCLRAIEGLPAHDEILSAAPVRNWYLRLIKKLGYGPLHAGNNK